MEHPQRFQKPIKSTAAFAGLQQQKHDENENFEVKSIGVQRKEKLPTLDVFSD